MAIIRWQYLTQWSSTFTNHLQKEKLMLSVTYPCPQNWHEFEDVLLLKMPVHSGRRCAAATLSKVKRPKVYVEVKTFSISRLLLSLEIVTIILLDDSWEPNDHHSMAILKSITLNFYLQSSSTRIFHASCRLPLWTASICFRSFPNSEKERPQRLHSCCRNPVESKRTKCLRWGQVVFNKQAIAVIRNSLCHFTMHDEPNDHHSMAIFMSVTLNFTL